MSADGELYVNEVCRDTFANDLDKEFGKGNWELDASGFCDFWDLSALPKEITVKVLDDNGKEIGEAKITSKFEVEGDDCGRYVEAYPDSIKITKK